MTVSTKGRYALRIMLDLAVYNTGEPVRVKDIAKRQDISEKYLEQIVTLLTKNGLIKSVRGAQGGYLLKRQPEEYTIGDILRAAEGDLNPMPEGEEEDTAILAQCERELFYDRLYSKINEFIDTVTLADLINDYEARLGGFDFVI